MSSGQDTLHKSLTHNSYTGILPVCTHVQSYPWVLRPQQNAEPGCTRPRPYSDGAKQRLSS